MHESATAEAAHYIASRRKQRRGDTGWVRRALIFLTCCVLANALFGEAGLAATMRARQRYTNAEEQLRTLKSTNAGLREQVRRLSSDPEEIEDVARTELGLIRSGEVLFVIRNVR
jgi:cell division protein FtsB